MIPAKLRYGENWISKLDQQTKLAFQHGAKLVQQSRLSRRTLDTHTRNIYINTIRRSLQTERMTSDAIGYTV